MNSDIMSEYEKGGKGMPKGSPELTASRKEEIVNACETLYQTMSFKEITIKEIGAVTSFTRTSIYNYFHTKEEIFLALMQREYEHWAAELHALAETHETLSADAFASALAHSLEQQEQLLKLLAMNHYDMEANSRPERLTKFKVAYGASLDAVTRMVILRGNLHSQAKRLPRRYINCPRYCDTVFGPGTRTAPK